MNDVEPVGEELFAKYLVETVKHSGIDSLDPHWRPQTSLCPFCADNFDVVGKMETFEEDRDFLLEVLKVKHSKTSTKIHDNQVNKPKSAEEEFLSKISPKLREEILFIYRHDFDMLGYSRI